MIEWLFFYFLQSLKFAIFDWSKQSQDHQDQDSMGTMECTLAEAIAASSKGKFERGLSPFRQHLGDSGVGEFTMTLCSRNFQNVKLRLDFVEIDDFTAPQN